MTVYIKVSTQEYPLYPGDIILEHPELEGNFTLPAGYSEVRVSAPPEYDKSTDVLETQPPAFQNGEWVVDWVVRALTPEEIERRNQLPPQILEQDKKREELEVPIPEPLPPPASEG